MDIINDNSDYLDQLFNTVYAYPSVNDPKFQEKIYVKKEFNDYQIKHIPEINNYNDLEKYRKTATSQFKLAEYQKMLSNYFNPDTPFNSLLLFHGLGTGKTCCAINIASKFYDQVKKYNTQIYILVPGPILKESWINEIKNPICSNIKDVQNRQLFELFNIMSYKAFNKRVLGEKIKNKNIKDGKYKRNEEGEILRNESYNKISSLDNTLLIVDEAHNITNNDYGLAVKKIAEVSKNLKILLLTGTPMKNAADDLITLLDIMNTINDKKHKSNLNEIFIGNNHTLDFSKNGEKILRDNVRGKISYIAGGDKYLFAIRNDLGIIPDSLKFTKIIPIKFNKEQYKFYANVVDKNTNGLEKSSSDVCNFIFPKLIYNDEPEIELTFGREGLEEIVSQLMTNTNDFNKALTKYITDHGYNVSDKNLIYLNNKTLTGSFLHNKYLKLFSPKFHQVLNNIQNLVEGKKGPRTAFIYSNLVLIGINMFKQVLLQNGFIEFNETKDRTINSANDDTVCYYCGVCKKDHKEIKTHVYYPASFIVITGDQDNDEDMENNEQKKIIDEIFSSNENRDGKYIKLILGSRVIAEGYNIRNLTEVHILDVYYNFARVDQAVGRAIRKNSHRFLYSEKNPYPVVDVYKYCMVNNDKPTIEELLYQKAEKKHAMIKYVEHIIKQEAIDKYLNYEWNNKPINKCIPLEHGNKYDSQIIKDKELVCKAESDYLNVSYLTNDDINFINKKHKIDTSTFTDNMIKYEINTCKQIIKSMYLLNYAYTLDDIIKFVKEHYNNVLNIYYIYKALDDLIPTNDNDFNNMDDNITIDKYNKQGYLIYVNNYYIFQPFDQPTNIPMYYRIKKNTINNYNKSLLTLLKETNDIPIKTSNQKEYDFVSVSNYYNNRKQNDIIGIIDKEPNVKKNKNYGDLLDTFKLRDKITMKTDLKRKTGLQSYTGAVCYNAYQFNDLMKKLNKLDIKISKEDKDKKNRKVVCDKIKDVLLALEKYSEDNTTYCIIPKNHPVYEFPYNLLDRSKFIVDQLTNKYNIKVNVEKLKDIKGYKISLIDNDNIDRNYMTENKFELNGKSWIRILS